MKMAAFIKRIIAPWRRRTFVGELGGSSFVTTHRLSDVAVTGKEAYRRSEYVAVCIRAIAEAVSSVPLKVYTEIRKGDEVERQEIFDSEIGKLLSWISPDSTAVEFRQIHEVNFSLLGNAFWVCEGNSENTPPTALELLDPTAMRVISTDGWHLDAYEFSVAGKVTKFKKEDIVHFRQPNPYGRWFGLSPTEVMINPLLLKWYTDRWNINYFKHGAVPSHALVTDQPVSQEDADALKERWQQQYAGVDKIHQIAVLGMGAKPEKIGELHKDMGFKDLARMSRESILAVFGVPPVIAGIMEYANYANAESQIKQFWKQTIIPRLTLFESVINEIMIPRYWPNKGLFIEHDLSKVKELQEDALKKSQCDVNYVKAGILTVNEVRRELNKPDVEWGNEPPSPQPAFGALAGEPSAMFRSLAEKPPDPERERRIGLWKAFDRKLQMRESKFSARLRRYFKDQGERLKEAVEKQFYESSILALFSLEARHFQTDIIDRQVRINTGRTVPAMGADVRRPINMAEIMALFIAGVEMAKLRELAGPTIEEFLRLAGQDALKQVGVDALFDIANPKVVEWVKQKSLNLVTTVHETSKAKLQSMLAQAVDEGQTIQEISKNIGGLFDGFADYRSTRIARTEVISAHNNGSIEGYKQSDVVEGKEWLATFDDATRDTHADADGQVVALDASFNLGGMLMQYPGDPAGDAADVINCRCTVLPVVKE